VFVCQEHLFGPEKAGLGWKCYDVVKDPVFGWVVTW